MEFPMPNPYDPDPNAAFIAELREAMSDDVIYAEATRATAHPLTIVAQSFDMPVNQ